MSTVHATDPIAAAERPAFFDGQGLTAGDLTHAQRYHREMRWRHNRTLHGWGVAEGLAVSGAKGAVAVDVAQGYALDAFGRELIVAAPRALPVPAIAVGRRILTLSYVDDARQTQSRAGICGGAGAVRLAEGAELRWRDPDDQGDTAYQPGLHVLLASVTVKDCVLAAVALEDRREARMPPTPLIYAGATPEDATVWSLWRVTAGGAILGVETAVDTSVAGFRRTPRYQAQLVGMRRHSLPGGPVVLDGLARVSSPTATGFTLRVLMPQFLGAGSGPLNPSTLMNNALPALLVTLRWHVNWLGIED